MNFNQFEHRLWIIGHIRELPVSEIWSHFLYGGIPDDTLVSFRSSNHNIASLKASKIESILDSAHFTDFEVDGEGFTFSYGQNGGNVFDRIIIDCKSFILSPEFSEELVSTTLAGNQYFTQAHLVDRKYEHIQNIYDPLQFKALGISMDGLPMKSNGLPFPLEQQIVDISQNPGRFELSRGYVKVSAAYMWFGEHYWKVTELTPEKVIKKLPNEVSMHFDKCWKLVVSSSVFRDQKTIETQNSIRRAIFE